MWQLMRLLLMRKKVSGRLLHRTQKQLQSLILKMRKQVLGILLNVDLKLTLLLSRSPESLPISQQTILRQKRGITSLFF